MLRSIKTHIYQTKSHKAKSTKAKGTGHMARATSPAPLPRRAPLPHCWRQCSSGRALMHRNRLRPPNAGLLHYRANLRKILTFYTNGAKQTARTTPPTAPPNHTTAARRSPAVAVHPQQIYRPTPTAHCVPHMPARPFSGGRRCEYPFPKAVKSRKSSTNKVLRKAGCHYLPLLTNKYTVKTVNA
jgi:hypothetical protein